jgi:hypothetical protein
MTGPLDPAHAMAELRAAAQRLWAGLPGPPPVLPATLSARQLQALLQDLTARREQIATLREQLGTFDEQLAGLQTALTPLLEWAKIWSGVERSMTEP